jgi:hypothetical protein
VILGFGAGRSISLLRSEKSVMNGSMFFSRADGTLARDVPAYRRIMPFLMRGKNESAAYFEQEISVERSQAFIADWNARSTRKISFFHLSMWAAVQTLAARPRLNRFIAGSRIYQRKGIWISYSAKKKLNDDSPVVVRKIQIDPSLPFADLVDQLSADLDDGRAEKRSHVDKELSIVLALPGFLLRLLLALQGLLYGWNLLPQSLIRPDPLFASLFVGNLGSLKMDAIHHHLYEYGNIPAFACIGRRRRVVVANDAGEISTELVCVVKYTYDERVEDGLNGGGRPPTAPVTRASPALPGDDLRQLAELRLPACSHAARPDLVVHRAERQHHAHAVRARREVDAERRVVGAHAGHEVDVIQVREALVPGHLAVGDLRRGGERHVRLLHEGDLRRGGGGHRVDELPAGTQVELDHLDVEALWSPPRLDPVLGRPEVPDVLDRGVEAAFEHDAPVGRGHGFRFPAGVLARVFCFCASAPAKRSSLASQMAR